MATKAKTKANRTAERKSSRSQGASRNKERQPAARNAFDILEEDHREVEGRRIADIALDPREPRVEHQDAERAHAQISA